MTSLACEVQNVSIKPTNKTNSIIATTCGQTPSGDSNSGSSDPKQQWDAEIESCYRAGTCRAYARRMAAKCGLDAEDLLHSAIERALEYGSSGLLPVDRVHGCIRSIASTYARTMKRANANGSVGLVDPAALADYVPSHVFSRPDIAVERLGAHTIVLRLLTSAAGGDATQAKLIDCMGDGLKGQDLANVLGINLTNLASRQRRLKRAVVRECGPYLSRERLVFSPTLPL